MGNKMKLAFAANERKSRKRNGVFLLNIFFEMREGKMRDELLRNNGLYN
jgi:hypothetical protein